MGLTKKPRLQAVRKQAENRQAIGAEHSWKPQADTLSGVVTELQTIMKSKLQRFPNVVAPWLPTLHIGGLTKFIAGFIVK